MFLVNLTNQLPLTSQNVLLDRRRLFKGVPRILVSQWPFLHYDEAKDSAFCYTCLMAFKLKKIKSSRADPAFVRVCNYTVHAA